MPDPRIERLKELLKRDAVKFGDFTLASGKKSDVYVDGRLFTLSSDGAALVAEVLWERMAPLSPDAIGGMTLGADPIVGATIAYAGRVGDTVAGFLVRKEPKGHGTKKCVEGPRPEIERPRVLIVEDTATTGGSSLQAAHRVKKEWNAEVIGAFVIVDRGEGAAEAYAAEGIEFHALLTLDDLR